MQNQLAPAHSLVNPSFAETGVTVATRLFPILGEADFPVHLAGKKAAHLHRLKQAGFRVPLGFVVSDLDFSLESIEGLPSTESLALSVAAIGGFPVAVRSSGVLEDLEGASFAGQYLTRLNVSSMDQLREAITECRSASSQTNVIAYARSRGIEGPIPPPALLIQKMVDAEKAGVAFGIHPVTGQEEHCYVELCAGLGEKLVSGLSNPTRLTLSHHHDGKVIEEEAGEDHAALLSQERSELVQNVLEISAHFGSPQDVEWAISKSGELYILQSRPITQVTWRSDTEEMTNADLKDGGVSARVCTPMMFSLYRRAFQNSMQAYFENVHFLKKGDRQEWMHSYYGRVYWNAGATKRGLVKIPGFDEASFDRDLGIQKDYGKRGPTRVSSSDPRVLVRAIPVAIAIETEFQKNLKMTERFASQFHAQENGLRARLQSVKELSEKDFAVLFQEVIDQFYPWTEESYFTTIYNNSNAQTLFKELLAKIDTATESSTQLVHLLSGLTDVSHLEMQRDTVQLFKVGQKEGTSSPSFQAALEAFLKKNDFHGDAELELLTPRWGEAPERVRKMIEDMIVSKITPSDPDASAARQREEFEREVRSVEERIKRAPISWFKKQSLRRSFHSQLARVRTFLTRREAMRELSSRAYYLVRLVLLEATRRLQATQNLNTSDDLFFLHWEESLALVQSEADVSILQKVIQKRKLLYQAYRSFQAPNEFGAGIHQIHSDSLVSQEDGAMVLKGTGCSPGIYEGRVRVIESVEQMSLIEEGDILVTRFTDPGWTPVLGLVRGIITEVGGMLSHAAVISREYGIPAVLNLPGAMKQLQSAERVRIDGNTGKVTVISASVKS